MRARVIAGVCAAWLLVAIVWGSQNALGAALQGNAPMALSAAIRVALIQTVPWIPATLAIVALAARFPVTRASWTKYVPLHLLAAAALSYGVNMLVVLGFWQMSGNYQGIDALLRSSAMWGTLRLHIVLLIYMAIHATVRFIDYYRVTRARELQHARVEGQLVRARLQALNAQIRPHFLFNTLHTIGQLWRSGRSDDADAVLDHLGSLFHRVQHSTDATSIPLRDELELVRDYLAIEQVRFRDRLRVHIDAQPDTLEIHVPPLILQPLVENAIRHGVSTMSSAGSVSIRAHVANGMLSIVVCDDGPGFSRTTSQPGTGTGLANTRERLSQLYGSAGSLSIDADTDTGAVVTVTMPATTGV